MTEQSELVLVDALLPCDLVGDVVEALRREAELLM
jgi:hypothetical protein